MSSVKKPDDYRATKLGQAMILLAMRTPEELQAKAVCFRLFVCNFQMFIGLRYAFIFGLVQLQHVPYNTLKLILHSLVPVVDVSCKLMDDLVRGALYSCLCIFSRTDVSARMFTNQLAIMQIPSVLGDPIAFLDNLR